MVVVDYGAGNLRSVARAIAHVDTPPAVSADPGDIDRAQAVVLPGVGAAADTMSNLQSRGLVEPLREYIRSGRPFLGVCMGLQALFDYSEEGGRQECLGVLPGVVRHFGHTDLKVPHMGWNTVDFAAGEPLAAGLPGRHLYFVHSYYVQPEPGVRVIATSDHGGGFCAGVRQGNLAAVQFHPEKSGTVGLALLANFLAR